MNHRSSLLVTTLQTKRLASAIQLTGMMLLSSEREGGEAGIDQIFYYISELLCAS